MKITAHALEKMPVINSSLSGEDKIIVYGTVNLGMATAVDNGLIVPVIRNANKKSLLAVSRELKDLAYRARNGGLQPEDMQGATFTVSNLGGYGSVDLFTPIVNPPQAAILGIGRAVEQAVPVGGEIQIRSMLGLSFTYDHRVIDGALAAEFMKLYLKLLENPARSCC
jgi:pyruvate dehydrogenase E2 component (dihydrolipoamide acetyltransferase)